MSENYLRCRISTVQILGFMRALDTHQIGLSEQNEHRITKTERGNRLIFCAYVVT